MKPPASSGSSATAGKRIMVVVDTSVFMALLEGEPNHDEAVALFRKDPDFRAPELLVHEVLNVLTTLERLKKIDRKASRRFLDLAVQVTTVAPCRVEWADALEMASRHRLTGYDGEFLAAALSLGCRLATYDKQLLKAAPEVCAAPPML